MLHAEQQPQPLLRLEESNTSSSLNHAPTVVTFYRLRFDFVAFKDVARVVFAAVIALEGVVIIISSRFNGLLFGNNWFIHNSITYSHASGAIAAFEFLIRSQIGFSANIDAASGTVGLMVEPEVALLVICKLARCVISVNASCHDSL